MFNTFYTALKMGVNGLWKLIESCGENVALETLENKVLAVDISIWLHQIVKGFQDGRGSAVANAHLLGLFHRLCKLLYYRIKPVFVFDGKVPTLKKNTIAKRKLQRNKLIDESERIQALLLQSLAKEKVVQEALGNTVISHLIKMSPLKAKAADRNNIDDIFIPPGETSFKYDTSEKDFSASGEKANVDFSFSECKARGYYNQHLQSIDLKSKDFRNLPADVRHEILVDIKETRKQSSWAKLNELPSKGNEFSLFQMKKLLKRRQVQTCLEDVEKEMGSARSITINELEHIFHEDGIIQPSGLPNSRHVSSDANTRFLLVRDWKKSLAHADAEKKETEIKPETSKYALSKINLNTSSEEDVMEKEYDRNMQKAIVMSLDLLAGNEQMNQFQINNDIARDIFKDSVTNNDSVCDLLDQSQSVYEHIHFPDCGNMEIKPEQLNEATCKTVTLTSNQSELLDLNNSLIANAEESSTSKPSTSKMCVEITVNPFKISSENDDLFDDIQFDIPPIIHFPSHNNLCDNIGHNEVEGIGVMSSTDSESEAEEVTVMVSKTKPLKRNEFEIKKCCAPKESKINNNTITEILADLKKEASEVSKITLNEIGLGIIPKEKNYSSFVQNAIVSVPKIKSNISQNEMNAEEKIKKQNPAEKIDNATIANDVTMTEYVTNVKLPIWEVDVAAKMLKNNKTNAELEDMASALKKEAINLEKQRNRQSRMGTTLSEKINIDCMELLRLFGVPFIVAPMEAEAQCAFLDKMNVTDGTITDDSDIWLFGGRTVYKNFFAQNKYVLEFKSEKIESQYKINRDNLIQLALLVGSDYTTGINGIGPVTALEIIASFSKSNQSEQQTETVLKTLYNFRSWWTSDKTKTGESSMRHRLRNKLKNIELAEAFPNPAVAEAYLEPIVDINQKGFSWGSPNVDKIKEFTKNSFGWTILKTEESLGPVLKQLKENKFQTSLKKYFLEKPIVSSIQPVVSKRVQTAISKMSANSNSNNDEADSKPMMATKYRKRKLL